MIITMIYMWLLSGGIELIVVCMGKGFGDAIMPFLTLSIGDSSLCPIIIFIFKQEAYHTDDSFVSTCSIINHKI